LFLHAARALGAVPEDCAVVEDTELGLQAAVAAGMHAFAYFPTGGSPAHPSVRTLRHLSELEPHLVAG
jgi:beta-phosphoglucomutase-like phosphatase (HAD superfamily)